MNKEEYIQQTEELLEDLLESSAEVEPSKRLSKILKSIRSVNELSEKEGIKLVENLKELQEEFDDEEAKEKIQEAVDVIQEAFEEIPEGILDLAEEFDFSFDYKLDLSESFKNFPILEGTSDEEAKKLNALLEETKTIIESVAKEKINEAAEVIREKAQTALIVKLMEVEDKLKDQIDEYMEYVVEKWVEDNQIELESSVKSKLNESFVENMKELFSNHYIDIPESRVNVVEKLALQVEQMEKEIEVLKESETTLAKEVVKNKKNQIVTTLSENLTILQKSKLEKLAEDVDFEDESSFSTKIKSLKNFYFTEGNQGKKETKSGSLLTENKDVITKDSNFDSLIKETLTYLRKN